MKLTIEQMKANRKLWIEALRSGKYRQAKEALRRKNGSMCCLGVLCELMGVEWTTDGGREGKLLPKGTRDHTAPSEAMEFVGLVSQTGNFDGGNLADLNDSGKRFKAIASIIENEPPGLFADEESA